MKSSVVTFHKQRSNQGRAFALLCLVPSPDVSALGADSVVCALCWLPRLMKNSFTSTSIYHCFACLCQKVYLASSPQATSFLSGTWMEFSYVHLLFFFFFPSLFLFFPCLSLAAAYWWITKYLFLVVVLKKQERCRKRQLPPNSATSLQTKISFSLCSFPRKSFVSITWKQLFPRCTATDPTNKYCDAKKHPYQTSVHMPSDRVCYLCSKWR